MAYKESIQERRKGPLRVCEAQRCGCYTQDALTPWCKYHKRNLSWYGNAHAHYITLKEVRPYRQEVERTLKRLYATPKEARSEAESTVALGLTKAVRHVERWLSSAAACWPCVGREEMARLAVAGVKPNEIVLRFLAMMNYAHHSNARHVLGTAAEIKCAVGRTILRCAKSPKYPRSKRTKDLPVPTVREVGDHMREHFGRVAFQLNMLANEMGSRTTADELNRPET